MTVNNKTIVSKTECLITLQWSTN